MSTEHSTITDPYIHEPKGVAAANDQDVYVADGASSGDWTALKTLAIPPVYGEMYIAGNTTSTTTTSSATYYQVTAGWVTGLVNGVTFSTDELVCVTPGIYCVECSYSIDRPSGAGTDIYKIDIGVDTGSGLTAVAKGVARAAISNTDVENGKLQALVTLAATNSVGLLIQNEADIDAPRITDCNFTATLIRAT